MKTMAPKVLAIAAIAGRVRLRERRSERAAEAGLQHDRQDRPGQEQAKPEPEGQSAAGNRHAARENSARPHQAAARLQGGSLVARPRRRTHHGDGREGHHVHGDARDRPRLCHHRARRQARGQGPAAGSDAAQRPRVPQRLALRVRDQPRAALRQHRGQARQSRRAGRADARPTTCPDDACTTTGNTSRSARTGRCTCRSAPTATSARSTPASTARSAATMPTAPAWRSSRAACATRSASTGIR